jgi:hypothetical protein
MRQKPPPPPWITFYDVLLPAGQGQRHYRSSWSTRTTGQVAVRCHHPDCCPDGDIDGHLIGVNVTADAAALRGAQHSATHQPTDKAS